MASFPPHDSFRFVADLLAYMTLEEKLGQLDLFHAADDPELEEAIVAGRVGGVASGAHGRRWQGLATERSRLGIPLLQVGDLPAPSLSPWALAASWDESLARELGASAAREAIERGCNAIAGPRFGEDPNATAAQLDIAATDPHLLARLAGAFCRGAGPAVPDARGAVLALAKCSGGAATSANAAALELAHSGHAGAIDCEALDPSVAQRAGLTGILIAECTRIRAMIARQFATTRVRSRLEAAERALADAVLGEDAIDAAVRGVLTAKHAMGLFREPQRRLPALGLATGFERPEDRVRATMVLLRNEAGLLPFSPVSDRVLVVGAADGAAGACADALARAGIGNSTAPGLAMRRPGERWCDPVAGDHFALALTRDAAKRVDFVLVVLEDRHFVSGPQGRWRVPGSSITALLRALAPVGSRLVALIATSDPVDLADADQHFAAVLQCWTPGAGFAEALGDVLSGRAGPRGRMPVAAGRFAFGQGLGFGECAISGLRLAAIEGAVSAQVTVRNSGSFEARETVQAYRRCVGGDLRLVGFRHVELAPAEEAAVELELRLEALGAWGPSGRLELAPGPCEILVGKDQRRLLSATFDVTPALARAIVNRDSGLLRLAG